MPQSETAADIPTVLIQRLGKHVRGYEGQVSYQTRP
jgi:hypothetical protein